MRILLADDHGIVRRGMRALLESEPRIEVAGEAADGREALKLCFSLDPDIAIIDIGMPRLNGIDVTAQAVKQSPKLKVIILSMYADESYVVRALSAGARAYLLKEATEEDLLPAVRAVAAGRSFFSPAVSRLLLEDYEARSGKREEALDADPCPEPVRYLWHAFCELSATRGNNGFGPNPLQWSEIEAWSRLDGQILSGFERTALLMLDRVFLEAVAKKKA